MKKRAQGLVVGGLLLIVAPRLLGFLCAFVYGLLIGLGYVPTPSGAGMFSWAWPLGIASALLSFLGWALLLMGAVLLLVASFGKRSGPAKTEPPITLPPPPG